MLCHWVRVYGNMLSRHIGVKQTFLTSRVTRAIFLINTKSYTRLALFENYTLMRPVVYKPFYTKYFACGTQQEMHFYIVKKLRHIFLEKLSIKNIITDFLFQTICNGPHM